MPPFYRRHRASEGWTRCFRTRSPDERPEPPLAESRVLFAQKDGRTWLDQILRQLTVTLTG